MSHFAETIMLQKYSHTLHDGTKEKWENISYRVAKNVLKSVGVKKPLIDETANIIAQRKFIPGGRYLYAAGRPMHQCQNCLLLKAEDSREGWSDLMNKSTLALMTGAGIGIVYSDVRAEGKPIRRTGGTSTGPIALMQMINEAGRGIMQGGARRSAIWAGLHWNHPDIFKFIHLKDWIPEVRALKERDFNFPATMDGTNISVILDTEFFKAYHNDKHRNHSLAHAVYWEVIRQMLKTGEPGFSIDCDENEGENLRNAPVTAGTLVLTIDGYKPVSEIIDKPTRLWTGYRYSPPVTFKQTNSQAHIVRVSMTGGRSIRCDVTHPFLVERFHGAGERKRLVAIERIQAKDLEPGDVVHVSLPRIDYTIQFSPDLYSLGYIYGDGSFGPSGNAEITFCTEESKACARSVGCASDISSITEEDARGYIRAYFRVSERLKRRSKDVFPTDLYSEKPSALASFVAGLFDSAGTFDGTQNRIQLASVHVDFLNGVSRLLEQLGIKSVVSKGGLCTYGNKQTYQLTIMSDSMTKFAKLIPTKRIKPELNDDESHRDSHIKVLEVVSDGIEPVYCVDVEVEEHSFVAEGVVIANCTEITSYDDSDICNLGSINMARIESLDDMKDVTELSTALLLAGTVYSDVPYSKVDQVRTKNRRLGLGLMGLHEWLLFRGKKYGPDSDLAFYLLEYASGSDLAAQKYSKEWEISTPIKTRAIAPTGSIGILAETTTGAEPLLCSAYKRRYLKHKTWNYQYVIEPIAKQFVDRGINPDSIEDAYSIDAERRVQFQVFLQSSVDHAISSTINLPSWGSEHNNEGTVQSFGTMLIKYLPKLRGVTCYPDGARGGQPLTPVKYATALKHIGQEFVESGDLENTEKPVVTMITKQQDHPYTDPEMPLDICDITKGGSCGT